MNKGKFPPLQQNQLFLQKFEFLYHSVIEQGITTDVPIWFSLDLIQLIQTVCVYWLNVKSIFCLKADE